MRDPFGWLFSSSDFMPHGMCYLWQPGTLWLNVASDGVIAAAYYAIPFALYYLVRGRRSELPYPSILLMFAAFIFLCGTTHLMEIWTVWHPDYRVAGLLKALTGIVSVITTLALFRIIPQAMLLRTPQQLQREVDARTAELANLNEELRAQIDARDLAEAQLRDRDRRKDEFLATLAHELRNPLAPIRHAVKILSFANSSPERQQWSREVIDRQARRMALLLDDLLDVSRITQGRLKLRKERVALASLVNSAIDTVRPAIEEKGHTLSITQADASIEIAADPLRLSQAISNLLTNAAKYTPRCGRIELKVTAATAGVLIRVTDTGIGFEPAKAPALFEMFCKTGGDNEGSEEGLGIGLSLVKGLVELHGGSVQAESAGKGLGAAFTITLPGSVILPAAPPAAIQENATSSSERPARILIADDNRDAADSLGMLLRLAGHEVHVAHSGGQAIAMARQCRPDIAILDIGMPDISGYDVARSARNEDWGRSVFLIALTGWGQAGDKEKAHGAGFDRHLTKPVDAELVTEAVSAFLATRSAPGVPAAS